MKKKRLLSLLLSAAMLMPSIPLTALPVTAAQAVESIDVGDNVLDGVSFTADVTKKDVTSEKNDGYLHVYDVPIGGGAYSTGVGYQTNGVTFKANTAYYFSFDMRIAYGSAAKAETASNNDGYWFNPRTDMKLVDILEKNTGKTDFFDDMPSLTSKITADAKALYGISQTEGTNEGIAQLGWAAAGHWNIKPPYVPANNMNSWVNFEFVFVPTSDSVDPIISFNPSPSRAIVPFDIDDFAIYTKDANGAVKYIVEPIGFDSAADEKYLDGSATSGSFFTTSASSSTKASVSANFSAGKLKIENGTEYTKLVAPTGSATVEYDTDGIVLTPGLYELSGEARLNYFQNQALADDNKSELEVSLTAGETINETYDIYPEWTIFDGIVVNVTEDTPLSALTLTFSDATRGDPTVYKTVDMRNISLVKTAGYGAADSMLEGASAKTDKLYSVVNVEDGNKFLHINQRKYSYTSSSYKTLATSGTAYLYTGTYSKDVVYYMGFDARMSVEGVSTADGYAADTAALLHYAPTQFNVTDISAHDDGTAFTDKCMTPTDKLADEYVSGQYRGNEAKTFWKNGFYAVEMTPEWTYYEFAFKPAADVQNTNTNKTFVGFSNIDGFHSAVPIDIDNIMIWYYEEGAKVPTYITNDNFDIGSDEDYFTSGTNNQMREENFCNAGAATAMAGIAGHGNASVLSITDEYDYEKISAKDGKASITYTLELAPGLYSFKTDARLDYYNPGGAQAKSWYLDYNGLEGGTPQSKINHLTYVANEDNKAAFSVTVNAGDETVSYDTDITTEWTSTEEIAFTVPTGAAKHTVTITVTMDDTTSAANQALDLKNQAVTLKEILKEEFVDVEASAFDGAPARATNSYEFIDVEDGNKFMHVNKRAYSAVGSSGVPTTGLLSGVGYQHNGTYKAGTMYYIGFYARTSVETISTEDGYDAETAGLLHVMKIGRNLTDTLAGEGGSTAFNNRYLTPTDKLDSAYVSDKYLGNEAKTVWQNGFYAVELTSDWTYYEFAFVPADDIIQSTHGNSSHIGFSKLSPDFHSAVPIDIDDAKIWYYEAGSNVPTYITNDNFDDAGDYIASAYSTAGRDNNFFSINGSGGHTGSCNVEIIDEYDYEKIGAQNGEASITYTFELEPGFYTLAGSARLDYYNPGGVQGKYAYSGHLYTDGITYGGGQHKTYVSNEDNKAELTVTVTVGGETRESTTVIYTEWGTAGGFSFEVPEGNETETVTVTYTMKDRTSAKNMALNLRELKLSALGKVSEAELGEGMLADVTALSSADITAITADDKYNKYLHLYDKSETAMSGIGFMSSTLYPKNSVYYVTFDARVSLPTASENDGFSAEDIEIRQAVGAMFELKDVETEGSVGAVRNSNYLTPTDKIDRSTGTYKDSENEAQTVWNEDGYYEVVLTDEWQKCEFIFVPAVKPDRRKTGISIFTSSGISESVPINIDNFEIFQYNVATGVRTTVEQNDFESGSLPTDYVVTQEINGRFYASNGVSGHNKSVCGITVERDRDYDRISLSDVTGAVIIYDFGGMELEPGVYALDGIARQDYYNAAGLGHETSMLGEDNTVTYSAIADYDGKQILVSADITEEWTELPTLYITVPNGSDGKLDKLTVAFADKTESYNNGIAVRELNFRKVSSAYDTNDSEWTSENGEDSGDFPRIEKTETYIEVTNRTSYLDLLKYENEDIALVPGETYTLTLMVRGIPNADGDCGKLGVYLNYPISSRKVSGSWGAEHIKGEFDLYTASLILSPEWEEHKMVFTARDEQFALLFEGEHTGDHATVFHVAGLSLVRSDELGNPIGGELISDFTSEYSDGIGWSAVPYTDDSEVSFSIVSDSVYRTAKSRVGSGATLSYDTDEQFEPGTYTVKGKVRLGNRDGDNVEYSLTRLTNTKWLTFMISNKNSAKLILTVDGENCGKTAVNNEWTDIEFTFTLTEKCVPEIELTLDSAFNLDFADLKISAENN